MNTLIYLVILSACISSFSKLVPLQCSSLPVANILGLLDLCTAANGYLSSTDSETA